MTWLARWFGRRNKAAEELEDEPARFSAPGVPPAPKPVVQPVIQPTPSREALVAASKAVPAAKTAKGFDPYNSGAFESRNAWERVSRR